MLRPVDHRHLAGLNIQKIPQAIWLWMGMSIHRVPWPSATKDFGVKSIQALKMLDPRPVQPSLWISSSDVILVTVLSASSLPIPKYQLDHFSLGGLLVACLSKICRATFRCCWLQIATMDYFGLLWMADYLRRKTFCFLRSTDYVQISSHHVISSASPNFFPNIKDHNHLPNFVYQLFVKFIGPPGFQYVPLLDEGPARLKLVKPSSC